MSEQKQTPKAVHAGFKVNPTSLEAIKMFLFDLKKNGNPLIPEKVRNFWRTESYFACIHIDGWIKKVNSSHVEDWYVQWSKWASTNYSPACIKYLYIMKNPRIITISIIISGQPFYLTLATNGSIPLNSIKNVISSRVTPVDLSTESFKFDVEPYIERQM
jgi:hypothetical protein